MPNKFCPLLRALKISALIPVLVPFSLVHASPAQAQEAGSGAGLFALFFCAAMVAIFAYAWKKIILPVRESAVTLQKACGSDDRPDPSRLNDTPLEEVWTEFIREWKRGALTIESQQWGVVKGSEVFDTDNLLTRITNPNYLMAVPSLMTGLGLLGTFIGLVMGISALDLSGAENLMTGIRSLLGGTRVAFSTSLTGIFLALLWGHLERLVLHDLGLASARFAARIDAAFPSMTQAQLTARLIALASSPSSTPEGALLQATARLTEAIDSIGNKQAEASERAARETASLLGKALGEAMAPPLQAASETLQSLENWHEKVITALTDTAAMLDKAAGRIEGALGQNRAAEVEMAEQLNTMRRELKVREDSMEKIVSDLSRASGTFQGMASSLSTLADRHIAQMERSVEGMAAQADLMQATTSRNAGLLEEFWDKAGDSLEKSVDQGIAPLLASITALSEGLRGITEIERAASREVDRASNALKDSIRLFSDGIDLGIKRYFQNFDSNIDEICDKIAAMAKKTSSESENLTKSIEQFRETLSTHLELLNHRLESVGSSYKPGLLERLGRAMGRGGRSE